MPRKTFSKASAPAGAAGHSIDLPLPDRKARWVARRKAEVVRAVEAGRISLEEACRLYALSLEEFASWQKSLRRSGLQGLKCLGRRLIGPKRKAGR